MISSRVRTGTLLYPCAPPILTQSLSLPSSARRLEGQGEVQDAEGGDGQKEEDTIRLLKIIPQKDVNPLWSITETDF